MKQVGAHWTVGESAGGFFTCCRIIGIETKVFSLVSVIYPMVNFRKVEVVAAGITRTELTLAGIDPDPLIEGSIEHFNDGVATGKKDFKILSRLVRLGIVIGVTHADESGRDMQTVEGVAEDFTEVGAPTMVNPGEDAFELAKGMQAVHRIGWGPALRFEIVDDFASNHTRVRIGGSFAGKVRTPSVLGISTIFVGGCFDNPIGDA